MENRKPVKNRKGKVLFALTLFFLCHFAFSQNSDYNKQPESYLSGKVTVTTKGISTIPSFTLGKPAVIFDLSMGKGKLSFDPQLRFSMEGKPWSFLFWWRYQLVQSEKFQLKFGAHPALSFKDITVTENGVAKEVISMKRFLAGELAPNYSLSTHFSIGTYYLYSYGVEKNAAKNHHFIALRTNFSKLKLSDQVSFSLSPQVYYLKVDEHDGFYFSSGFSIEKKDLPVSLTALVNKTIGRAGQP